VDVSNAMLSCLPCWRLLPDPIKKEVLATRRYPLLHQRRREALKAAADHWRGIDG
jgi:hypothetical protein